MLKRLLAVSTATLLTLATYAFAADLRQDHPSTYTVQKGDTLWDISARFLQKPWLWPEIWQANPQVKNPHRIYPGDVLSLVYIDGRPTLQPTEGPRIGESVETVPLKDIEPFLKDLTVVDDVKSLPYVIGIEDDRLLASAGQLVYVSGLSAPEPGQRVQIARPTSVFGHGFRREDVSHAGSSVLNFRGDRDHRHWSSVDTENEAHGQVLGYELMRQSTGEVIRVKGDIASVLLRDEGRDVRVGDRILPENSSDYDAQFQPHSPGSVGAGAMILAIPDGLNGAGPKSVVTLATGAADGVSNGTVFSVWHTGAMRPDSVAHENEIAAKNHKVAMPDDYLGHVMVFRTFDKVSYALVMDGIRPILVGDVLKDPDAEP